MKYLIIKQSLLDPQLFMEENAYDDRFVFKELYDLLVKLDVYEIGSNYPSSKVLYVSRVATFAASIKKLNLKFFFFKFIYS